MSPPKDSYGLSGKTIPEERGREIYTSTLVNAWLLMGRVLAYVHSGLEFTCIALSQNVAKETEELADSFRNAYGATLKPHHNFLIKPVFSAAMGACPYRKTFYEKLGSDEAKVQAELRTYLVSLEKIVAILKGFQERKEAKW